MANARLESPIESVAQHLRESAAVKQRAAEACPAAILSAAGLISGSFRAGGKLLLCGNGGSAADCQHMAAEFTSRLSADFVRPGLPAIALTTDTSFLTAFANDFDFDGVFARQVQALGKPGDVLLGISTSGRSKNVIQAVEVAKAMGLRTVVLTGSETTSPMEDGGSKMENDKNENGERRGVSPPVGSNVNGAQVAEKITRHGRVVSSGDTNERGRMPLLQLVDVAICVPSDNTQHIQEAHIAIEHIICHLVERAIFGEQKQMIVT